MTTDPIPTNDRLRSDAAPASRGFVYDAIRTLTNLIKETHGGKIAALERRVAELEDIITRP